MCQLIFRVALKWPYVPACSSDAGKHGQIDHLPVQPVRLVPRFVTRYLGESTDDGAVHVSSHTFGARNPAN